MTLWFVFAVMTAAAIFAVLWPLGRPAAQRVGGEVAVYRDQLDEIERDRTAGLIGEAEAEAARVEVSRRLLAAADAAERQPRGTSSDRRRRAAALVALVVLPCGAAALYLMLGSPQLPGQPLAARLEAPQENRSVEGLVAQVEAHLERNPEDGRGWEVIAPVYMRSGRFEEAVKARRNVLAFSGENAERQADLGEALMAAANGVVTADAKAAFERAVALEASNVKARYFIGLAAEQDGRRADAVGIWRAMLAGAPADAPWTEFVRNALARVGETPPEGGPNPQDMAAAAQLTEEQRSDMVRGMVARLADRLKQDGSDVEGWLRLVRAYMVLGERDKASAAASDARRAMASDPGNLQRLDDLVKGLGLEG
jgi:cytochrome c-type biogenesis protein CcmH